MKRQRYGHKNHIFFQFHLLQRLLEYLVDEFIMACDELILFLKVVGALICGENYKFYSEDELDMMSTSKSSHQDTRLKIRYETTVILALRTWNGFS